MKLAFIFSENIISNLESINFSPIVSFELKGKKKIEEKERKTFRSIIETEISRRAFLVKAGVHQPLTFPRPNSSLDGSTGFVNPRLGERLLEKLLC